MANGGITPAAPAITVHPMVRTRKNVPISSVMYLFMVVVLLPLMKTVFSPGFARHRVGQLHPLAFWGLLL